MWIRSQDNKTLANVNELYINPISYGYEICSSRYTLGSYSTEENALKALSMLEAHIAFFELANINHYVITTKDVVFEMPQDWSDD